MSRLLVAALVAVACSPAQHIDPGDPTRPDGPGDPPPQVPAKSLQNARQAFYAGRFITAASELDGVEEASAADLRAAVSFFINGGEVSALSTTLARLIRPQQLALLANAVTAGTPAGDYVHGRLMLGRLHRGDEATLTAARELRKRVVEPTVSAALDRAVARWTAIHSPGKQRGLGVLLPLSGPHKALGEAALRSIKLGAGRGARLIVRDTRGDADAAAALVDDLVLKRDVVGILGPLGSFESTAAARRAAELGVPILVLAHRDGIASGPPIFSSRVSASQQGTRLARYAVREMNLKRFGLAISDTPYGWALAGAFWNELVGLDAQVMTVVTYERGTSAPREVVRRLVSGKKGKVDFQALLIADDYTAVRKLTPFLPFWGVKVRRSPRSGGVQLLGGHGWNHRKIIDEAERQTENAVFCDTFFPSEDNSRVQAFVRKFYAEYREPPTSLEAEVYDASALMARALAKGGDSREALLSALQGLKRHRGVTGTFRFDDKGAVVKDVTILTVDQDTIRPRNSEREERASR